jgi:hypothetical protein
MRIYLLILSSKIAILIFFSLLRIAFCENVLAQGKILFNNRVPGTLDAPFTLGMEGPVGDVYGNEAVAQLCLVYEDGSILPLEPVTTFRQVPNRTAYVEPVVVNVPGFTAGQKVTVQIFVWRDSYDIGITDDNMNNPHLLVGSAFDVTLGTAESPASLIGLTGGMAGPLNPPYPRSDYRPHYTNWTIDLSFNSSLPENANILALRAMADGIEVDFTTGSITNYWKLNTKGERLVSFPNQPSITSNEPPIFETSPDFNGLINSKAQFTSNDRVIFEAYGGNFTMVDDSSEPGYAVFHSRPAWPSGTGWKKLDLGTLAGTNQVEVYSVGFDIGGSLIMLGNFTALANRDAKYLGRVTLLGADPFFNTIKSINGAPNLMSITNDIVYIGGSFTEINGKPFNHLARIVPAAKFHARRNGVFAYSLATETAILERSTDMIHWEPISTLNNSTNVNPFVFPTNGSFRIKVND